MFEDCRRFEYHHPPWRDRNFLAGLGIASDALAFLAYDERAERGELHRLSTFKTVSYFFQDQLHECGGFRTREAYLLVYRFAEVRARDCLSGHRLPRLRRSRYPTVFKNVIRLNRSGQRGRGVSLGHPLMSVSAVRTKGAVPCRMKVTE